MQARPINGPDASTITEQVAASFSRRFFFAALLVLEGVDAVLLIKGVEREHCACEVLQSG